MKRALFVAALALFFVAAAKADSVGPTWDITAAGLFSGGGQSEAFALNWTLTFQTFAPGSVMPVWSGTTSFAGVLGTFTQSFSGAFTNPSDGGFIAFSDPQGDEIDIHVSDYIVIPSSQMNATPTLGVPYLYSCNVASICTAYGTTVGFGLFSGTGTIVQTAHDGPAATPEPSTLLLLFIGIALVALIASRQISQRRAA